MGKFKGLDGRRFFQQPDNPFLLLTEDMNGRVSYSWWNSEEKLYEDANKKRKSGERILYAIEISSCRNVDVLFKYTVDDFINSINSAYNDTKERGFDSIVLVIDTNAEQTYYINETEDGFQCDEFDYYFDDLDSIAETLFNEKIIGKPVEIRIE